MAASSGVGRGVHRPKDFAWEALNKSVLDFSAPVRRNLVGAQQSCAPTGSHKHRHCAQAFGPGAGLPQRRNRRGSGAPAASLPTPPYPAGTGAIPSISIIRALIRRTSKRSWANRRLACPMVSIKAGSSTAARLRTVASPQRRQAAETRHAAEKIPWPPSPVRLMAHRSGMLSARS